ncbi:recombinase family protein [Streptomyces sp. NPDC102360]|uniref:recombinase family protein n=1 Tax=Streptomyces sp. NPDC102360 TaxID=3366160 RepID=UPI003813AABE
MEATSYGAMHPGLADALEMGGRFEEWLAGRTPVVSYARVSLDGLGEGRGVNRQHLNSDVAATKAGWAVVHRYTDSGVTASDPTVERPAFVQLLRALRMGRTEDGVALHGVIAMEEERLVRLARDEALLHRALAGGCNGFLYLVDEGELIHPSLHLSEVGVGRSAPAGQRESERMSKRRLRSVRDHAREGRGTGGARRFGWLGPDAVVGRRSNTLLHEDESPYLREAIDRVLAGQSWTAITDWLTAEGVPTVREGRWTVTTVQSMVTNPAICGYRVVDGALVRDPRTGEPVVGDWQPVATPGEWTRLIERCGRWHAPGLGRRATRSSVSAGEGVQSSGKERKYLLAGFLVCGHPGLDGARCGAKMGGQPPKGTNRHPSYRCVAAGCRRVGRRVDLVDEYVVGIALGALEERYSGRAADRRPFPAEQRLADLRACAEEEGHVAALIRDLEEDRKEFLASRANANLLAEFTRERWPQLDVSQRRLLLREVIESVTILPIPRDRSRNAPFDRTLIQVAFKQGVGTGRAAPVVAWEQPALV